MPSRLFPRRRSYLFLELLEQRLVLDGSITVPLDPQLDQFGDQIVTVQAYGDPARTAFSIFDTGSSAVTFSPDDQAIFADTTVGAIPIKVPGGAVADGIGGSITGDVSEPGTILVAGLHAANLTFDSDGFPVFDIKYGPGSAATPGIQAFVGTTDGSPILPTITGTPILNPSPDHPKGFAAQVDMQGVLYDFSDVIPGLILAMPDINFVDPNTQLKGAVGTTDPVTVPLQLYGGDNHDNPGDLITASNNAVQPDVSVVQAGKQIDHQTFLFDTGAQLSVISTAAATALGLDLAHPETSITVQGVAGDVDVPGFTMDKIVVPTTTGTITFTNAPVYVLDVADGIDGILGMNLFDTGASMLFDPLATAGPSLSLTFYTDPSRGTGDGGGGGLEFLHTLGVSFTGAIHGHTLPAYQVSATDVSGRVLQDVTGANGQHSQQPLAGQKVFLDANNNGVLDAGELTASTDKTGTYLFANPAAGHYSVREIVPAGMVLSSPTSLGYTVTVANGTHATGLDFANVIPPPSSVSGRVFEHFNGDGSQDPSQKPLPGLKVFLDANNNGVLDAGELSTTTDGGGTFLFTNPVAGRYTVREVVPAGLVLSSPTSLGYTVVVASGSHATGLDFANVVAATDAQSAYVTQLYGTFFDRSPDAAGLGTWVNALQAGVSNVQVSRILWRSAEHRGRQVDAFYATFLHRQPGTADRASWVNAFLHGASETDVAKGFVTSGEYQRLHSDTAALVMALYNDLLGRAPDPSGQAFWQGVLNSGDQTPKIASFVTSTEALTHVVDQYYSAFLHRPKDPIGGQAWLDVLQNKGASLEDVGLGFLTSDEYLKDALERVHP